MSFARYNQGSADLACTRFVVRPSWSQVNAHGLPERTHQCSLKQNVNKIGKESRQVRTNDLTGITRIVLHSQTRRVSQLLVKEFLYLVNDLATAFRRFYKNVSGVDAVYSRTICGSLLSHLIQEGRTQMEKRRLKDRPVLNYAHCRAFEAIQQLAGLEEKSRQWENRHSYYA